MSRVVVVGAGVAGLTAADRLIAAGHDVTVLERGEVVGGLARSFRYGDFVFDIGPHRFHTYDAEVEAYIRDVLGGDVITIGRRSGVWMFDRAFEWPLSLRSALRLPPGVLARAARDLLSRRPAAGDDFESFIRARYGETLYQIFFKPYTERFTGTPCNQLSSSWARTSLERALIDRGISADTLANLIRSAVAPRAEMQFLYPESGGVGVFSERLAARIAEGGGRIVTGGPATALMMRGERVRAVVAAGGSYPCDELIWTGPITRLCELLSAPVEPLSFLSLLVFNVCVRGPARTPYQWCYYSDAAVPFSRVSAPTLFNPRMAPAGDHGLCVEIPVLPTDGRWHEPERLTDDITAALVRVGLVGSRAAIAGVHVERVAHAYPLYTLDYQRRLARAKAVVGRFGNVRLLGRSATFSYNNMDGSIAAALALSGRERTPAISP